MWEHGIQQQCDYHLKIDGAWKQKENGRIRAAYGWVLERRHLVNRVGSGKIFALSPLQAEAHSLLEGITAVKAEVDVVQISTDSKRLIQILRNPRNAPVDCTHILSDILCILNLFSYCCIRKAHRLEIRKAHNLAIQARREPY
ncbi:Metallo-beta-lactamase domain-containing protein 1 [Bienertia sinuspersici]